LIRLDKGCRKNPKHGNEGSGQPPNLQKIWNPWWLQSRGGFNPTRGGGAKIGNAKEVQVHKREGP